MLGIIAWYVPRKMTPAERQARRDVIAYAKQRRRWLRDRRAAEKRWWKQSVKEARMIARLMSGRLSQLGLDYIFSFYIDDGERRRRYRKKRMVKFTDIVITPDLYAFKVDTRRLPRGVNELEMIKEEVTTGLSLTIAKPVTYKMAPEIGFWYMVDRETGLRNIPRYVTFTDANAALTSKDGPLAVIIGQGANRTPMKIDFQRETTAHLLVAGASGGGKTNLLHVLISTLIRQDPNDVKLILIDLKRIELPQYSKVPHLERPIVVTSAGVIEVVRELRAEVDKRLDLLGTLRGVNSLKKYNARKRGKNRIPYKVCIFDEYASIMVDGTIGRKVKDEIESHLAYIASIGRAAGIHLVLATQRPEKDVIRPLISANFNARIAYQVASVHNSVLIIGNGDAFFKEEVPAGRAILATGGSKKPFQTAFVSRGDIDQAITNAESGRILAAKPKHDVTMAELALFAMKNYDYGFRYRSLWREFKSRGITQPEIVALSNYHREVPFIVNGVTYILVSNGRKGSPVKIVEWEDEEQESEIDN